jgi:GNAT superfamily N-acetyltransferase
LSVSQIDAATEVMVRAFKNDSEVVHYFPDEADRKKLKPMYRLVLDYSLKYGEAYTTSPALEGIALWLPPGATEVSIWEMIKCGAWTLPFKMSPSFLLQYINSLANVKSSHHENAPFTHWYLFILCVDTGYQSKGYASKLLKPMLARIDREHQPCYLETTEEIYVPLYKHFGFKVVEAKKVPGTPVGFWAMLRDAR